MAGHRELLLNVQANSRHPVGARYYALWLLATVVVQLSACASAPLKIDRLADEFGFDRDQIRGTHWEHVVYLKPAAPRVRASPLHVYIEGDGTPFVRHRWPVTDPTTRNPLMLELMAQDSAPSVYLGRPCYLGLAHDPACNASLWTNRRYSGRVVASMAAALDTIVNRLALRRIVLIGHSGGGTLAMLLANHFTGRTDAVVTLAGNLDTTAWTRLHGYTPLTGSLNPADTPLAARIEQWHLVGRDDDNIPVTMTERAITDSPSARILYYDDVGHCCAWREVWPHALPRIFATAPDGPIE